MIREQSEKNPEEKTLRAGFSNGSDKIAAVMAKAYELRYSETNPKPGETARILNPENPETNGKEIPFVVYFSSITCNTKRFVDKLNFRSARIPLRAGDEFLKVDEPYVLAVPTYGGGSIKGAVPKQVIKFLNDPQNRSYCRGVIASGNTNFGEAYGIAGDIIAKKVGVPYMFRYELLGTPEDVARCSEGLRKFWQTI